MQNWNDLKIEYILKEAKDKQINTFVDLGCGPNAEVGKAISKHVKNVKCIDILDEINFSESNITYIKTKPGLNIPLSDESIDAIWVSHLLEHVCYLGSFLLEIRRTLKVGGYVFVAVPPFKYEIVNHFSTGWSVGQLAYVLAGFGFNCVDVRFTQKGYNVFGGGRKGELIVKDPTHFGEFCVSINKVKEYMPLEIQKVLNEKYESGFKECWRFNGLINKENVENPPQKLMTKTILRLKKWLKII